jgi:hypothetical protein
MSMDLDTTLGKMCRTFAAPSFHPHTPASRPGLYYAASSRLIKLNEFVIENPQSYLWGTVRKNAGGENQAFDDMDAVQIPQLR